MAEPDVTAAAAALRALVDALAPLMDRDYCQPFTSAWELDPFGGPENWDGKVIYERVRTSRSPRSASTRSMCSSTSNT